MNLGELCDDLLAERADLVAVLAPLDESAWHTPTPAPGWSVLDQITHLAFFDDRTRQAIVDPDAFLAGLAHALADVDGFTEEVAAAHRHLTGEEELAWLVRAGLELTDTARSLDGSQRVPWYGPTMSLTSHVTARIMETWAHGQDVVDALGAERLPTDRLRHVAFLGARAVPNSYVAQGRPVPEVPVRVELTGPSGDVWAFGPDGAADVVRGPALDFCLVVTQRRHRDDTALTTEGAVAAEWLSIAQAFAGPPGTGREPG
ncbi:MAG: wyosine base formation [Actinomycetia bacterium]|nr:wyosine base formation [Actinomycetes bacterium]